MITLHPVDLAILVVFVLAQTYIGVRIARQKAGERVETDFLLDGRRLTLPAFVASLVCTWYGGILGVGEYTWRYGISNWLVFGVPYYLWAFIFAWKIAARARETKFVSIADHLYDQYGRTAGMIGSALVFVMTVPAPYVLTLGVIFQLLFGWSLWTGVVIGALLSVVYVYLGGFRSVIRTDLLQFLLMFGGFALILPFCYFTYGGFNFLRAAIPETHFTWHGGNAIQFILVWYIIASTTMIEPAFYQRCYAAKNMTIARRGIFTSIGFWFFFDFLTTTTGLYARAVLPNLADPVAAFPTLAVEVLPPVILGLFFVGLLSTVISTVDSYSFLAAIALGRDVIWRNLPRRSEQASVFWTRVGLWISAGLATTLALLAESVVGLWHDLGSIGAPALVVPVLSTFSRRWRLESSWAVISMIAAGGVSLFWLTSGRILGESPWMGVEPIIPGLVVSLVCYYAGRTQISLQ